MNICLSLDQLFLPNVFFLDAKQNMIIHGKFTQLVYSDEFFSMNGLSITLPFVNWKMETVNNNQVKYLYFQQNNTINQDIVKKILDLETLIIELYKRKTDCTKRVSNLLRYQLSCGSLKIQKNYHSIHEKIDIQPISRRIYIIKLSGVWESDEEVGITFKVLEMYQ
uniref:Uncharacterized protein n=1 Tax=viral metagenome TaxID=1070528 RepID=A0A6C0I2W9_9ZZZZ